MFRVGFGQDSHQFSTSKEKPLVIAGVTFPDHPGFEANSDGDVAIHALCNAIEQALGNISFSYYADGMCQQGITDSREYLKFAAQNLEKAGYSINNIGLALEGKTPKIAGKESEMKKSLAAILSTSPNNIGITATSGEGLTAFGQGRGVQAFAIISLKKI